MSKHLPPDMSEQGTGYVEPLDKATALRQVLAAIFIRLAAVPRLDKWPVAKRDVADQQQDDETAA